MYKVHFSKGKKALLACGLAMLVGIAMPVWSVIHAQAVDLQKKCSVTIQAGSFEDKDHENANVQIDLYQVASAQADSRYDTYGFKLTDAYASLNSDLNALDASNSENWTDFAAKAAQVTLTEGAGSQLQPTKSGMAGTAITDIDAGLYLVVAHGADVENYTAKNQAGNLITKAYSSLNEYTFQPELIALPTKQAQNGEIRTDGSYGDWIYDINATMKSERSDRMCSLDIVKTLNGYDTAGGPASFVFQIEAVKNNTKVYSSVETLVFTEAGEQTAHIVEKIPVGSVVTVTEVYSGASYTLDASTPQTAAPVTVSAEQVASVHFINNYSGDHKNGGSINNKFSKIHEDAGDRWSWTQEINGSTAKVDGADQTDAQ